MVSFPLFMLSTLATVLLFAGREFAGAAEVQLYEITYASLTVLWVILATVSFYGHFRWRAQRQREDEIRPTAGASSFADGVQLGQLGLVY